jgi:hypothetical protein
MHGVWLTEFSAPEQASRLGVGNDAGLLGGGQGAQFALLGLDLGQAAGIGVCSVQRLDRGFGPVGEKCAQNVLGALRSGCRG